MTPIEKAVHDTMKIFNEEYRDKFKISKSRFLIWCQALNGFDPETIRAAALHLVVTRQDWPPDIATLRQLAINMQRGELATPEPAESWANVLQLIQGKEVSLTPLEKQALKMTGDVYNLKLSQNLAADRSQFMRAYAALVKRRDDNDAILPPVRAVLQSNAPALPAAPRKPKPQLPAQPSSRPSEKEIAELVARVTSNVDASERH